LVTFWDKEAGLWVEVRVLFIKESISTMLLTIELVLVKGTSRMKVVTFTLTLTLTSGPGGYKYPLCSPSLVFSFINQPTLSNFFHPLWSKPKDLPASSLNNNNTPNMYYFPKCNENVRNSICEICGTGGSDPRSRRKWIVLDNFGRMTFHI
jgi:hypothetical protein